MRRPQWLQFLGLEFWLPLPLLGLVFWGLSGWLADSNLNLPSQTVRELQITQNQPTSDRGVLSIIVNIDRDRGLSQIIYKQTTKVIKKQEFELSTTEITQLEAKITQKLGLPIEQVRQLIRYQVKN
jgi:hypothetical protein